MCIRLYKFSELGNDKKVQTLNALKPGSSGIVKKIGSSGALRRRIVDMGITPGVKIKVEKYAPFGDPVEISLHGYDLSIRKSDASQIEIYSEEESKQYFEEHGDFENQNMQYFSLSPVSPRGDSFENYNVALIGNPNSGKTTLFNSLTGSYQYVGNWPGVTVGRKEGRIKNTEISINLVDLPGIYSLSPYSPEEIVTRNYILNETPDLVINILDATNLERNLYLTTQLMELDCRMILVLNMTDLLSQKGKVIDYKMLEKRLGVTVIPVSAGKNIGIEKLIKTIEISLQSSNNILQMRPVYSSEVENAIGKISDMISGGIKSTDNQRFKSIKIFEDDPLVITESGISQEQAIEIEKMRDDISAIYDKDKDIIVADERYKNVCNICSKSIKTINKDKSLKLSHLADKILTGKYTAIPCFLLMIFGIFYITFGSFGVMLKNFCERFINVNTRGTVEHILNYVGASGWSKSLVLDAVIGGVGAVISFLPQVILLFTLISLLEDCGYMARAAFIMDKPFRKIGLSGKAFVPIIMGFGCTVPAVLGTKILESRKDRNLAIFLLPFMSCSAKMPVYLLFASAFFPDHQTLAVLLVYLFGIIIALVTAAIFKDTLFKGEDSPFIMEMPEYKMPSAKNVFMSVWDRTRDFIERAGTVILIATVAVWFLQSFGTNMRMVSDQSESILAALGGFLAPAFSLCGFSDWRAIVSLLTGVMAKESIVSTLAILYGGSAENLSQVLAENFSVFSAVAFVVFALLYVPCIAAISAIHKEFGKVKLTFMLIFYQIFIAFVMSALVYQIGILFSKLI